MANFYKKTHQSGRSMIEMLGVLAIIGVLSVAGIAGYSKAMEAYRVNKLRDQVVTIFQNITTSVGNGQDASQFTNPEVADAFGILPHEMGTACSCRHALGGHCTVGSSSDLSGQPYNVLLRLRDLPPAACVAIATLEIVAPGRSVYIYINAANSESINDASCTTEDGVKSCARARSRTIAQASQECFGKLNAVMIAFGNKIW